MAEKSGLGIKICEIMDQVKYIKKNGTNNFNHYTYATEADVQDAVRAEMAKRHVFMYPDIIKREIREHKNRKGNIEYIGTVDIKFTFIDADTGEQIAFTMVGEGEDALDKAFYKAISGTQKYALMKLFMIPTGDDPERDNNAERPSQQAQGRTQQNRKQSNVTPMRRSPAPKRASADQVGLIKHLWTEAGGKMEQLGGYLAKHKLSLDNLSVINASKIIELLQKKAEKNAAKQAPADPGDAAYPSDEELPF